MSGCPPTYLVPNLNAPPAAHHCADNNNLLIRKVADLKPDIVVLSAHWRTTSADRLPDLIARIKAAGIKRIVVIGMPTQWPDTLPKTLAAAYQIKMALPARMRTTKRVETIGLNEHIRHVVADTGAIFFSPANVLCDQDGCLTGVHAGDISGLLEWDDGHLTDAGSDIVAAALPLAF
jgi:hypothetical protein